MRTEGLGQNNNKRLDDNYITHKMEEAFGYSEQQLVEEFDRAAALSAQHPDPRLEPPKGEFEKIMERVEREKRAERKAVRLKRVLRPLLVAALLGMGILGSGIGVNGRKAMDYEARNRNDGDAIFNNVETVTKKNDIENAYEEIKEKIGIPSIEFFYMPSEMTFKGVSLSETRAKLEFMYKENHFYVYEILWNLEDSTNYSSDRKLYKEIYNRYLGCYIPIYKNELEEEEPEFGAQFVNGDTFYYLFGIINEDEFIKLVEHIKYYEN